MKLAERIEANPEVMLGQARHSRNPGPSGADPEEDQRGSH
jgi:hypothetical protein